MKKWKTKKTQVRKQASDSPDFAGKNSNIFVAFYVRELIRFALIRVFWWYPQTYVVSEK